MTNYFNNIGEDCSKLIFDYKEQLEKIEHIDNFSETVKLLRSFYGVVDDIGDDNTCSYSRNIIEEKYITSCNICNKTVTKQNDIFHYSFGTICEECYNGMNRGFSSE